MFDNTLRPLKDGIFDPCCRYLPAFVTPLHITGIAFVFGLLSCYSALTVHADKISPLLFWALNRSLDCLDGALARYRGTTSDLGGFLDLLADFIIYSLIPIAVAQASTSNAESSVWPSVAVLEATFHINNFILFYVAAVAEKVSKTQGSGNPKKAKQEELTSVMMRPALVEGMESGLIFTAMLAFPNLLQTLSWSMSTLVAVGILQRTFWVIKALG
ncbi:MAG: hypothetical protein Q9209_007976 [Squamulea sp. 1 TL-2023]